MAKRCHELHPNLAHENGIVAGTIAREKRMRELSHRSKAFIRINVMTAQLQGTLRNRRYKERIALCVPRSEPPAVYGVAA
jgi:hypothetical protein